MPALSEPLISIVIPHYNNAELLCQALISIKNQTYPHIEVIVVDDASDSACVSALDNIIEAFPFVRIIYNKFNNGVSCSRNIGFSHANGFFLIFLDSDDFFYSPNKLEAEVATYFKYSLSSDRPIAVYSRVLLSNYSGTKFKPLSPLFLNLPQLYLIFGTMLPRDYLMPRSLFSNYTLFDESTDFYEDWIFRTNLFTRLQFVPSSSTFTCYRQSRDSSNLSRQKSFCPKLRYLVISFFRLSKDLSFAQRIKAFLVLVAYHIHVFYLTYLLRSGL